jgi:Transposase DDE domain
MCAPGESRDLRPFARRASFLDSLRELLTPAIWKQADQARRAPRQSARWKTQALLLTLLVTTWCCGDSQAERFETAKAFVAVCLSKRRRPGRTVQGFQKALSKLPIGVLRALAAGVRRRLVTLLDLMTNGFIVLGCDGSEVECPRVEELERRLDPPRKARSAPRLWVTALVHLRTGVLWAWRLGKGYNRERSHLQALLLTLPASALIVADAGYNGYELAQAIIAAGASFLIRMSAKDTLYTERPLALADFSEGEVLCWPLTARAAGLPALRVRLIRVRGKKRRQDVWLLTNVLDSKRLPSELASQYYRWRWENEGLFRTYKRTLAKVKLMSRTVRLVHREMEGALLAMQLLLVQGVRGTGRAMMKSSPQTPQRCSPRKVLLLIREVILGRIGVRQREGFHERLAKAQREQRARTSAKVTRIWPRRVNHKPPKPPRFLVLTEIEKALLAKLLREAA